MAANGLTTKQKLFVEAYLGKAGFNATEAARRAGYKGNSVTLASVGYENLRIPQIARQIEIRLQEAAMSADEVLNHLAEIARRDEADAARLKALELLGKHYRLFIDRAEISGHGGDAIKIVAAEGLDWDDDD